MTEELKRAKEIYQVTGAQGQTVLEFVFGVEALLSQPTPEQVYHNHTISLIEKLFKS